MLRSMTGFGSASAEAGGTAFRIELRSVNHRHLQVKTRLPGEWAFLEPEVERAVRARLSRGAVTVHLHAQRASDAPAAQLDLEAARRYQDQLGELARGLGQDSVTLESLLGLPGVVREGGPDLEPEALQKAVLELVDEGLARLVEMREREGASLAAELAKERAALAKIVDAVATRMPEVVRTQRDNLRRRVGELLEGAREVPESELAREIAVLADRLDVAEELARLASHLEQLDEIVAKSGAVGRKLDFLVQEIFREINTLGAKCSDAQVAHWVIDAKTHAERLREQVQNVE